jgi:hypothetical protein
MHLRYRVRWQKGMRSVLFRRRRTSDYLPRPNECTGFPGV